MFDFFHTAIANVTISSCLVGFFVGGHPALRLRGRKRTGSLSQFKRRHSFSVGSTGSGASGSGVGSIDNNGGGSGGGSGGGGGGGGGGGAAPSKRWWKGGSSAASAYELDIPAATDADAADLGAGAFSTGTWRDGATSPSSPAPSPLPASTPTSPRSFFSVGGGSGSSSTRHTQQTLEGLYLVLLAAGEGLRSTCEAAKLDGPAERVRGVVQDIQLGWRAAQARMAAAAAETRDPSSPAGLDCFSDDCTMEASRCLTVWSQQLSLAWADCRSELLFNRMVFTHLVTAHYSTLHSRLLEGCFVSDQRLDCLIGLGEERHKVLVKTTQGARDLGAGGSPVRALSDRFAGPWKNRPIVIEDRYKVQQYEEGQLEGGGGGDGAAAGGGGGGGGGSASASGGGGGGAGDVSAHSSSEFDSIATVPVAVGAAAAGTAGGAAAAAYGGSAAAAAAASASASDTDTPNIGMDGAASPVSPSSSSLLSTSSVPVKFKSTGSALSDALLADMLQESGLRVCDNIRPNLASTIPKKKIRKLHHDDYGDDINIGDGDGNGDGTGHLVICVHGLAGNQYDLRMLKLAMLRFLPQMEFMMSAANESNTHRSFDEMTDGFVKELIRALDPPHIKRVSFIGHSLGNVIIRNALSRPAVQALMEPHNPTAVPKATTRRRKGRPRMHTFLSLCGPHLGARYNTGIVSTGMWFMSKWKKSSSLDQLSMGDHANPRETFMYKLSSAPGFCFFKHVLLVSSPQDKYVPISAALLHTCHKADAERSMSLVYKEMVHNLLSPLKATPTTSVSRIYVMLPPGTRSINSLIGRTGHIALLDDDAAVEQLNISVLKYFR